MSQSLSLSMRPETLDDIIGHTKIVEAIRKKIEEDVIPSGFLLSGPPGTGKTTLALILSRLVQGPYLPGDEQFFDIRELNAADLNGVDSVRELVGGIGTVPMVGKYRVIIMDEAQMLTQPAQNILLKPLEPKEEGKNIFIFCTTDPDKIIPALKTRCMKFVLKSMSEKETAELVKRASQAAGVEYDAGFVRAAEVNGITSPREILMGFDKFVAGVPIREVFEEAENEKSYTDLAKSVTNGDWERVTELLKPMKPSDAKGLRQIVSAFLRGSLLNNPVGPYADAVSDCLLGMAQFQTFEDGVMFSTTTAVFYRACVRIKKAKS